MGAFVGGATDPTPYMMAAYTVGFMGIFGFTAWTIRERLKLRAMLATIKPRR